MVTQIRPTSLASEAFDRVVAAITSGEFEPGEKLSEADLARRLNVSRGPVREALQRLEGRLVSRVPHIGVRVIQFGKEELKELFYLREAMEGMAARLAATNGSDRWLKSLEELLEKHRSAIRSGGGRIYRQKSADEDFHFAIANASGCRNIKRLLLGEVYYQLRIHRLRSSSQPGRAEAALQDHREILQQLKNRDPEGAEAAMRRHIQAARESAIAALESAAATRELAEVN
ncbi:GntR family transcriptional regulator [Afifella sp. IM 167]|uniref:GntR family transcriptional regulator n=1 Tax=Afifella sp. IM 167 TaxID=2033586 RepID=UPI001CCFC4A8|nr:GntR family transcriptional regulator [Afifella sp. IM 167]MBZ8131959.1 GntR family transcriptional regulator [Afifella sp. IM 167]